VAQTQLSLEELLNQTTRNYENTEGVRPTEVNEIKVEISANNINMDAQSTTVQERMNFIKTEATQQSNITQKTLEQIKSQGIIPIPPEIAPMVKVFKMREVYRQMVKDIAIPQFFLPTPKIDMFRVEEHTLFNGEALLDDFDLSKQGINIQFDSAESELYKIDLSQADESHIPEYVKLDGQVRSILMSKILDPNRREMWAKNTAAWISKQVGSMITIPDRQIKSYIQRVTEGFSEAQFTDFQNRPYSYADKIKKEIEKLKKEHIKNRFRADLDFDKIIVKPHYTFLEEITPLHVIESIPKMLYEKETGKINDFEWQMITAISNLDNIAFWTRNPVKGFYLNGFVNHYPDFIVVTNSGKLLLIETKGDHLDGSDSDSKLRLGKMWENKAGNKYRYFMVFKDKGIEDSYTLNDFLNKVKSL
jgi:type III restriction enzyme